MAWAICEVGADASGDFREELKQHRAAVWGRRPWPGAANDEGQFLKHVEDMARVFAGCDRAADAWYPNRKRGPLVGQDLRSS